ncbi:MAG TPA: hypothetical protein VEU08_12465 [Vicinamibacterales bacterium]|nr:hypothetical protein [Vicinamibacterales bacterium]
MRAALVAICLITILSADFAKASAPQARAADARSPLFSSYTPLALRLEAPLSDLFGHKSIDDGYSVRGTLSYSDNGRPVTIRDVKVSVRGHTSRRQGECTFPKLKLDFPSTDETGPLFDGMKSVKIGTHCGDSDGDQLTGRFGRLANENSPLREALVYRLLDVFGVPTLRARPARIAYIDGEQKRERNAVIVEGDGEAMKRLGGRRGIPPEAFTSARAMFSESDSARVALAEAMIGNFDWCVKFYDGDTYRCDARRKLWNVEAVELTNGGVRPIIYDFDVAGMVAGKHAWFSSVFNPAFDDSGSPPDLEVLGQVQRTRSLFTRSTLDAARTHFVERKKDAYAALDASDVDDRGRQLIREYLDAFFRGIESDTAFYRQVVVAPGTRPFADADRARAVCPALGAIPVGTPISSAIDSRGGMEQVVLLDALWKWAPPQNCPEIHKAPVWIPSSAVSADYPKR